MTVSQVFLYLWENKVRPFFINDAKNHRNRLNHSCRKTRFKNITNAQINRFGPLKRQRVLATQELEHYCIQ